MDASRARKWQNAKPRQQNIKPCVPEPSALGDWNQMLLSQMQGAWGPRCPIHDRDGRNRDTSSQTASLCTSVFTTHVSMSLPRETRQEEDALGPGLTPRPRAVVWASLQSPVKYSHTPSLPRAVLNENPAPRPPHAHVMASCSFICWVFDFITNSPVLFT